MSPMKVGFIGCGGIARVHLRAVRASNAQLVGVADVFENYARRFAAEECGGNVDVYPSARELIRHARPDVVHVLTPPATHFKAVLDCLEAGCHVLVEKPMATTPAESRALMEAAERSDKLLSIDHNYRFEPVIRQARKIFDTGTIGRLVSVEVDYGYDVNRCPAMLRAGSEKSHWLYKLNGGPLEDHMAHPLSFVYEYLDSIKGVTTCARNRGVLPAPWDDEIRVILDAEPAQAEIYISFGIKPDAVSLTLRGTDGTIVADVYSMTVVVDAKSILPRAATRALSAYRRAAQHLQGGIVNVCSTVFGRLDKTGGISVVVGGFYEAIRNQTVPPVTMQEGHAVVELMHRIWPNPIGPVVSNDRTFVVGPDRTPHVLVTGASGFIGSHLVERLSKRGEMVRALVRPSSLGVGFLESLGCQIVYGDLSDANQVREAMKGIEIVYHVGAAMDGGWEVHRTSTVQGTQNILDAGKETKPKRIVYFSSLVVYDLLGYRNGAVVTEDHPQLRRPDLFGPYARGKVEAEKLVVRAQQEGVSTTIVRPGIVIGPRGRVFFPHMGFRLGDKVFLIPGRGDAVLSLVYIDSLVDGAIMAAHSDAAQGKVYNLVDDGNVIVADYIRRFIQQTKLGSKCFRLPFFIIYSGALAYEVISAFGLLKKGVTSRRQMRWKYSHVIFSAEAAKRDFAWRSAVPVEEAMTRTFDW